MTRRNDRDSKKERAEANAAKTASDKAQADKPKGSGAKTIAPATERSDSDSSVPGRPESEESGIESSESSAEQAAIRFRSALGGGNARRVTANFVDLVVLTIAVIAATQVFQPASLELQGVVLVYFLVFLPLMEASPLRGGPGKFLLRLKVVDRRGRRLSVLRSLGRGLAKLALGPPTLFLAWAFALAHPSRRALHDVIAKTYVVRARAYNKALGNRS